MKTFKELQENLYKALAKFGTQGLRKVASQAVKKGGTKKILDATTRRQKLDQLIVKNQKKLLNIRKEPTTTMYNIGKTRDNLIKYKKTHKYGSRPDGTYKYKNKFPDQETYLKPQSYGNMGGVTPRGILNPKSTSQSKPYYDFDAGYKVPGINRPEKIPPKVKKKLDTLDNLQGNMDFAVQRTQQIKTGSKKPLQYRRNQGGGLDTTDRFQGYTSADAQQDFGKFKGDEYAPKISGKGITSYSGKVGGYYGKGNKAKRRAGQKVKVSDFPSIGRDKRRSQKAEIIDGLFGTHKANKGSLIGSVVDIKKSKERSRKVREYIRQNQRRMANIKKGKGPLGMSEK